MIAATPRLRAAVWLAAIGIAAAIGLGRPEPAAIAAPFALIALLGLEQRRASWVDARLRLDTERAEEGDHVEGSLRLRVSETSDRLEVTLRLPPGLALAEPLAEALPLAAGMESEQQFAVVCERWGAYTAGPLRLRRYDRLRLVAHDHELDVGPPLRVYPAREALRALARPTYTEASVGDQVARRSGEGIELAELRPFNPGDDLRRINWRASARSGDELVVNEHHPERNATVILVVDAFSDLGGRRTPLDRALRAAVALAGRYLARRDRVGLLILGSGLGWLRPGSGTLHLHRIVDTLLEVHAVPPRQEQTALYVPNRLVPPQALLLALSPLLDDAVPAALANLRSRGYDLAVLELPPLPYLATPPGALAPRLIRLERDLLRGRLRARGITVVEWHQHVPLEAAVRSIEESRRRVCIVRAS